MADVDELGDGRLDKLAARQGVTIVEVRRWVTGAPGRTHDPQMIVDLYLAGRTQAQVAAEVGCSTDTVSEAVRSAGVVRTPPRLDLAEIARRAAAGQTLGQIAAALAASNGGVWSAMVRAGIPRRPHGLRLPGGRRGPPPRPRP